MTSSAVLSPEEMPPVNPVTRSSIFSIFRSTFFRVTTCVFPVSSADSAWLRAAVPISRPPFVAV